MNNYMFVEHRRSGGLALELYMCFGAGTDMMEGVVYPASASKTNQTLLVDIFFFAYLHVTL